MRNMKLIKQEVVDKAAKIHINLPLYRDVDTEERYFNADIPMYDSFKAGVEFAETQISELAVEFAEWINRQCMNDWDVGDRQMWIHDNIPYYSIKELFEIFLKERNNG
jgi:hypothetical protein